MEIEFRVILYNMYNEKKTVKSLKNKIKFGLMLFVSILNKKGLKKYIRNTNFQTFRCHFDT